MAMAMAVLMTLLMPYDMCVTNNNQVPISVLVLRSESLTHLSHRRFHGCDGDGL